MIFTILFSIIFVIISIYTIYTAEFLISIIFKFTSFCINFTKSCFTVSTPAPPFPITIILIILGLLLLILKIGNMKKLLKYGLIMLIISVILFPLILLGLNKISENISSDTIRERIYDMYVLLTGGELAENSDLNARIGVYSTSINAFSKYPIFGIEMHKESNLKIGEHSTILDNLASFGLIFSIPFLFLFSLYKETYKSFNTEWTKRLYFVCLILFTIFMLINTALFISIFYMLFVLSPMILKTIETTNLKQFEEENKKDENTLDS